MGKFLKQYGLLVWLTVILIAGFLITNLLSYYALRDAVQTGLSEQALPITSDNVYSEIQKDLLHPIDIAAQMARDTFVRDWLIDGEHDSQPMQRYLAQVRQDWSAVTTFLISEQTHRYYHPDGGERTVDEANPRDQWYFRVRHLNTPFEINLDYDQTNNNHPTLFINYRVLDYQGRFIGVTGLGLTFDAVRQLIDRYQERFSRRIYFVDEKGKIVLSGQRGSGTAATNIQQIPGLSAIAPTILQHRGAESLHLAYRGNGEKVLLDARWVPELGWYLLVEEEFVGQVGTARSTLVVNLVIGAVVTSIVTIILLFLVRRFQGRLEKTAATDNLTGLLNRHAFDIVFEQAQLDSQRTRAPLCVILFDIDHFKFINDKYGHLVGDHILREVGQIARRSLRESDVICRWGGEEYLILLKNCLLEKATSIAETLRCTVANNDFSRTTHLAQGHLNITVSMGVAQVKEDESEDSVFERADLALYQAKDNGRNSVYFSE